MLSPIWILIQGFSFLVYFWYIPIPILALGIFALYRYKKKKIKIYKKLIYLLAGSLSFPIIISILGGVFYDTRNNLVSFMVVGLFFLNIGYFIYLFIKQKKYRLFITSIFILVTLFTFGVLFVAGMSIANDWI